MTDTTLRAGHGGVPMVGAARVFVDIDCDTMSANKSRDVGFEVGDEA